MKTDHIECRYEKGRLNLNDLNESIPPYRGGVTQIAFTYAESEEAAICNMLTASVTKRLKGYSLPTHNLKTERSIGLQPGKMMVSYTSHDQPPYAKRTGWWESFTGWFGGRAGAVESKERTPLTEADLHKAFKSVLSDFLKANPGATYSCVEVELCKDFAALHAVAAEIVRLHLLRHQKECLYLCVEDAKSEIAPPVQMCVTSRVASVPPDAMSLYHLEIKPDKFVTYTPRGQQPLVSGHWDINVASTLWHRRNLADFTGLQEDQLWMFSGDKKEASLRIQLDQHAQTFTLTAHDDCQLFRWSDEIGKWVQTAAITNTDCKAGSRLLFRLKSQKRKNSYFAVDACLNQIMPLADMAEDEVAEPEMDTEGSAAEQPEAVMPKPAPQAAAEPSAPADQTADDFIVPGTRQITRPPHVMITKALYFRFRRAMRHVDGRMMEVKDLDYLPLHEWRGELSLRLGRERFREMTKLPQATLLGFSDKDASVSHIQIADDWGSITVKPGIQLIKQLLDGNAIPLPKDLRLTLPCSLRLGDGIAIPETEYAEIVALDVDLYVGSILEAAS